jgi:ATP synthase protein I
MVDSNDFKTRLKIAKSKLKKIPNRDKNGSFVGVAFKLGTELVSAVLVGTIIGFILDSWFGTKPWLIIIFFFLGSVAGIMNVIKAANRMQEND